MPSPFLAVLGGIVSRRRGLPLAAAALAFLGIAAAPRPAAAGLELLTITGATWTDGGSMSGSFQYHYDDGTGDATAAIMVDLVKSAGYRGGNYYFNAPGHTNTLTLNDVFNGTGSNLFHFVTSAGLDNTNAPSSIPDQLYLVVTGSGASATLASVDPNNNSWVSVTGTPGNSGFGLASIGTNVGVDLSVPEPASLAVLGLGLAAVGAVRRRRLAAQAR